MRVPLRLGERGFALVEILVAAAVWAILAGAMLYVMQSLLTGARDLGIRRHDYIELTRLLESWDAEATSSLAIFVPARDVLGADNADGHEFDFYARDAAHYGHFWAYRFDAARHTIQRYTYPSPGTAAFASDPPIGDITALQAARKPASSIRLPFLGGYAPKDVAVNFGYPGVDGGNALTAVTVSSHTATFTLELLPGTMTSGFSVVVSTFAPSAQPTAAAPFPTPAPVDTPTGATTQAPLQSPQPSSPPSLAPATASASPTTAPTTASTPAPTSSPPSSARDPIPLTVPVFDACQTGAVAAYDLYVGVMSGSAVMTSYGLTGLDPAASYAVTEHHYSPASYGGNGQACY